MDTLGDAEAQPGEGRSLGAGLNNLTGKQIGRYLVGQQLGSGGVATVYRAYDQVQGQTVALKLLLPGADDKAYTRFRNEAMTAGALRHPHIVRILQIGTAPQGEVAYIAMELVEGESLADLLRQHGRLRPEESANLLEPIARALAVAHQQGVVHRDVKPGNILLRPVSPGAANSIQLEALDYPVVPLLTDFGIARALDAPELTSMGRTVGTPAYMAPEQCAGSREVDGRADIYALGAVLYRCVAGRLPFTGTTTQILHAHVYDPLTIDEAVFRQLSPLLVEVLQRSLAKRAEERYATAGDLADALARAAGRTPPRPNASAGETTATLTMTAVPVVNPPTDTSSTTVLVPAPGAAATARPANPLLRTIPPAAPVATSTPPPMRTIPPPAVAPRLRPAAANLLLLIAGGLLVMALGVLLGMQAPRLFRSGAPAMTPTAASSSLAGGGAMTGTAGVAAATSTPAGEQSASAATVTTSPTLPPETPAPAPPPTATLAPAATETAPPPPTEPPAETPVETPTETPTVAPTETPTVTPAPGIDPTLAACLASVDPALREPITALPEEAQRAIGCPVGDAQSGPAQMLPLERGYMVGLNAAPELYVVYLPDEAWERQPVPPPGDAPPGLPPPPEGRYLPEGRFAALWQADGRWEELGFATESLPRDSTVVIQGFAAAVLIGNQETGQVVVLFNEKRR